MFANADVASGVSTDDGLLYNGRHWMPRTAIQYNRIARAGC
jgi:hypothetical protein